MSLSTPKPRNPRSANQIQEDVVLDRRPDPKAVISNDWVPATQTTPMHHAQPIRLANPLRLQWYFSPLAKVVSVSKAAWAARSAT